MPNGMVMCGLPGGAPSYKLVYNLHKLKLLESCSPTQLTNWGITLYDIAGGLAGDYYYDQLGIMTIMKLMLAK